MFLPLPQQQALQENQILVLQLEDLAAERRENTKKPILNMALLIPLSTIDSKQRPQMFDLLRDCNRTPMAHVNDLDIVSILI
jgi:hypothetical protein